MDERPEPSGSGVAAPQVVVLPPRAVGGYCAPLVRVPLARTERFFGSPTAAGIDGCLGDLSADDHLILSASSRNLLASRVGLRCRVSTLIFEPPAIQGRFYTLLRMLGPLGFHRVFTHQAGLAGAIANGRLLEHGGSTVYRLAQAALDGDDSGPPEKTGMTSIVASTADSQPGHRLRHRVVEWSRRHGGDLAAFGYAYRAVVDKAEAHLPFRYSVVIENSRAAGYFTEKLIDSLLCWSLPIYWGDPRITDHFDGRGLLVAETETELLEHLRRASVEEYVGRLPHLAENRRRAIPLASSMFERAARMLREEDAASRG